MTSESNDKRKRFTEANVRQEKPMRILHDKEWLKKKADKNVEN